MVWYLAHPVSPCERYTFEQNLEHTLVVMRICRKAGWAVTAPWYADCAAGFEFDSKQRALGLKIDVLLAGLLRQILLTGDRISRGMAQEAEAVQRASGTIVDATGIPDRELEAFLWHKLAGFNHPVGS